MRKLFVHSFGIDLGMHNCIADYVDCSTGGQQAKTRSETLS
jgi:hypothetical protein